MTLLGLSLKAQYAVAPARVTCELLRFIICQALYILSGVVLFGLNILPPLEVLRTSCRFRNRK